MSGGFCCRISEASTVSPNNQPPLQLAAGEVKSFMKKAGCASVYLKEPWNQKKEYGERSEDFFGEVRADLQNVILTLWWFQMFAVVIFIHTWGRFPF